MIFPERSSPGQPLSPSVFSRSPPPVPPERKVSPLAKARLGYESPQQLLGSDRRNLTPPRIAGPGLILWGSEDEGGQSGGVTSSLHTRGSWSSSGASPSTVPKRVKQTLLPPGLPGTAPCQGTGNCVDLRSTQGTEGTLNCHLHFVGE